MNYPPLKRLLATHSLPFCTPAGRLVVQAGFDAETGLYVHLPYDYLPSVPSDPSPEQIRAALAVLVGPWRAYAFASADDAAAMVAAVLTAVCRPILELCPAIMFEAAAQGSGKTLGATALGSLMTGQREGVGVLPSSDDELRKKFTAGALQGQRFYCLDNMVGYVNPTVLAALLTTGRLQDRVLGVSRTVDVAIRALVTMTANNASLSADLLRRTMRVRIDSGVDPIARRFAFTPPDQALRDRLKIAEAACVIWRAYFNAGAPRIANDDAGGFGQWVALCRQPVLWLQREGFTDRLGWTLGDPAVSMLAPAENHDPEIQAHGDMLRALWALSQGADFTARDALVWLKAIGDDDDPVTLLRDAVGEFLPGRQDVTARSLGKVLAYRRDRFVGSLVLRQCRQGRDGAWWKVEQAD